MKRVFTLLALTVICVAMSLSTAEAQRHNSRHDSDRKESYRGGGNSRPSRSPADRPGPGFRPGNGPGFNHGHHPVMRPPHRPWHRPVRPPHWRPPHRRPLVPSFFGITLGMAMNATINALVANNMPYYTGANEVFLNNVYQQNYYWPEAMLSYSGGVLSGSRFFFQTSYPDPSRFRGVYANLCASLGTPVSYTGAGTSLSASWLGYGGDYVTLEYMPMANPYGALRYYTILTYGN